LATAALPTLATVRSTTLVNSSNATSGVSANSARARSQRNFSPFDKTACGLTHAGGELNPTAVSAWVISRTGRSPKQSTTAFFAGQSAAA
jgi:hypothetical protein